MQYPSRTYIVRTTRGAAWWLALWTTLAAAVLAGRWDGPAWPLAVAIVIPALLTARILAKLSELERAGRQPGDVETFLFDLAVMIPLLMNIALTSAVR